MSDTAEIVCKNDDCDFSKEAGGAAECVWYCPNCGSGVEVDFTPEPIEKGGQKTARV